jgi:hypothetical protein
MDTFKSLLLPILRWLNRVHYFKHHLADSSDVAGALIGLMALDLGPIGGRIVRRKY